jgi:uncharacterized SAM-binding protein YcdF (DUF218 family)
MYRALSHLLQPYTLLSFVLALALISLWRRRRETRSRLLFVTVPFVLIVLLSTPAISHLAFGSLEWRFSPLRALPADNQALVVLAGELLPADGYQPTAMLGDSTLYRCFQAAELYRASGPCLVVASGGVIEEQKSVAVSHLMRDFLITQGVAPADVLVEDGSHSTYENALFCERLLGVRHVRRIALVTGALHMARAERCFRRQGFEVTPAPCSYQASNFEWRVGNFLPSAGAARGNQQVLHEWMGLCWYWVRGRL